MAVYLNKGKNTETNNIKIRRISDVSTGHCPEFFKLWLSELFSCQPSKSFPPNGFTVFEIKCFKYSITDLHNPQHNKGFLV